MISGQASPAAAASRSSSRLGSRPAGALAGYQISTGNNRDRSGSAAWIVRTPTAHLPGANGSYPAVLMGSRWHRDPAGEQRFRCRREALGAAGPAPGLAPVRVLSQLARDPVMP